MNMTNQGKDNARLLRRVQRAKLQEISRKVDTKVGELSLRRQDKNVPDYETPAIETLHEILQDAHRYHTRNWHNEDNTQFLNCAKCGRGTYKRMMRESAGRLICNRC